MTSFITKAALAVTLVLGALGAAGQANAGGVDVDVRIGGPRHYRPPVIVRPAPVIVVRPAPIVVRPAPVVVVKPAYGRCSQNLALQKAFNNGLNRAYVSKVGPNRVVVNGKIRGAWAKMVFANVRGCPRV
jgi:hypothetical protein